MRGGSWAWSAALAGLIWAGAAAQSAPGPPPAADAGVAALIAQVEGQYAAGMALYRSGQLDEARQRFDAALDMLLASQVPIRDTPALQRELDGLLDRIHALEEDAFQSGGGFSTQAPRAAPMDRVPELTFPLDPATRAKIAGEIRDTSGDLPMTLNDAVMRYIHYFTTADKEDMLNGYRRAGRYRAMIEKTFQEEGVPGDLIYLAQAESGFDTELVSSAGARGMWQFMASRSDDYGLRRTPWVDERQDPEKATLAAARHLKDLYAEFGDWYLAMAAYNAGPETIQRIVARTGYADYWELYQRGDLPKYVKNYVPIILATALIEKNPEAYGLAPEGVDAPDEVDRAEVPAALDLRLAADCAGVTVGDLRHLNPSLLRARAPAGFELKLPRGSLEKFAAAVALVPEAARLNWRVHWAQDGETVAQLARRYQLSPARLRAANPALGEGEPAPGQPLALPLAAPPSANPGAKSQSARKSHK